MLLLLLLSRTPTTSGGGGSGRVGRWCGGGGGGSGATVSVGRAKQQTVEEAQTEFARLAAPTLRRQRRLQLGQRLACRRLRVVVVVVAAVLRRRVERLQGVNDDDKNNKSNNRQCHDGYRAVAGHDSKMAREAPIFHGTQHNRLRKGASAEQSDPMDDASGT